MEINREASEMGLGLHWSWVEKWVGYHHGVRNDKAQILVVDCGGTPWWIRVGVKFMGERIRTRVRNPVGLWNGYGARIYSFNRC